MPHLTFELIYWGWPVFVLLPCGVSWVIGYMAGMKSAGKALYMSEYMNDVSHDKETTRTRMTPKEILDMPVANWNNPVLVARAVEDFHHITETKQ